MYNKAEKKLLDVVHVREYGTASKIHSVLTPLFDYCDKLAFPDLLELAQQKSLTAPLMLVNINQDLQVPVKCRCPMCFYLPGTHANVTLLPQ